MEMLPIIIPNLVNHITSNFCPLSSSTLLPVDREIHSEYIEREYVWPLLSMCIGFGWFFARNKAGIIQKFAKKGSQKTLSKLSKIFKGSQQLTVDIIFLVLTGFISWWLWLHNCDPDHNRKKDAFYILIATIAVLFGVIYIVSSYSGQSLIFLTPLIVWLFFKVEYSIRNTENIKPQMAPPTENSVQ